MKKLTKRFLLLAMLPAILVGCETVGDRDGSNFQPEAHRSASKKQPANRAIPDSLVQHLSLQNICMPFWLHLAQTVILLD